MKSTGLNWVGLMLMNLVCALSAQSQITPDSTLPTFTSNSRLVLVDVIPEYIKTSLKVRTITLATELKRDDFHVFDNGKEMPISSFDVGAERTARPIALWLVVQCPQ